MPIQPSERIEFVRSYLSAVEKGATGPALAAFYTEDAVQHEFPNRFAPQGASRDLHAILEAAERGRSVLRSQRFEIVSEMAVGESVALEVVWTGTLAIPLGSLMPGAAMRARFAMFLDFREGKISAQRNYDCFDPF